MAARSPTFIVGRLVAIGASACVLALAGAFAGACAGDHFTGTASSDGAAGGDGAPGDGQAGVFAITVQTVSPRVEPGGSVPIVVRVDRGAVTGELDLTATLPAASGVTTSPVVVPDGDSEAAFVFGAARTARVDWLDVTLTARARAPATAVATHDFVLHVGGPSGALDTTFGAGGVVVTPVGIGNAHGYAMDVFAAGIAVGGYCVSASALHDFCAARYTADGVLDSSFGGGTGTVLVDFGATEDFGGSVAFETAGRLLMGGQTRSSADYDCAVARLDPTGRLDLAFGAGTGKVILPLVPSGDDTCEALPAGAGKVLVVGTAGDTWVVARLLADGTRDDTYGTSGVVSIAARPATFVAPRARVLADGKLLLHGPVLGAAPDGGRAVDSRFVRLDANGALDPSFGAGGTLVHSFGAEGEEDANVVVPLDDGSYLVFVADDVTGHARTVVAHLLANGALDGAFGPAGSGGEVVLGQSDRAEAVVDALRYRGRTFLGSWSSAFPAPTSVTTQLLTMRLATGATSLDPAYGTDGRALLALASPRLSDFVYAMRVTFDGRLVVGGESMVDSTGTRRFFLARIWP